MTTFTEPNWQSLFNFFTSDTQKLSVKNKLTRTLISEYPDLGQRKGNFLCFSESEKKQLRQQITLAEKRDPRLPRDISGDRVETSRTGNEKAAKIAPNDEFVLITQQLGQPNIKGITRQSEQNLVPSISYRVHLDQIDLSQYDYLMVVENLAVFNNWHLANLPEQLTHCPAIYRGDNISTPKAVNQLLSQLGDNIKVVAFNDLDPAGLQIANTLPKADYFMLPRAITDEVIAHSQQQTFLKQAKQQSYLAKQDDQQLGGWYPLVQYMLANNLAVMQEPMLACQWPLTLLPKQIHTYAN